MKVFHNIIFLCTTMCLCLACSLKEDEFVLQAEDNGIIQLNAAVAEFSDHFVSTKASSESEINELTMCVFTADGDIVGRPVNIEGSNPTFLISTKKTDEQDPYIWDPNAVDTDQYVKIENGDDKLHYCDIYMVANAWDVLSDKVDDIKTLDELKAISIPVSGIDIPKGGFPMIGKQEKGVTFDLASEKNSGSQENSLATITLKKLYAKVNVRFQLIADQVVSTPTFSLTNWQVCNIPESVSLGAPADDSPTANTTGRYITSQPLTKIDGGERTISHSISGASYFDFNFYMPEHHLYPEKDETTFDYPEGMPEENKQRFKPILCTSTQNPTYVKVHGSYKDHQGVVKEVTYNVYLGQDSVDDFCVKRNQLLNNIITIKGITDSNPYYDETGSLVYPDDYDPAKDNISVDHRVEIGSQGFVISLEREAVMDSHFEVRPMDIKVSDGARVVVYIDEPDVNTWMRFETSGTTTDHIDGVGVRKYFTTNLLSEVLVDDENKSLTITEDTRLWLYFDENTNVYDSYLDTAQVNPLPKWRDIKLKVDYYDPKNSTDTPTKPMVYTFRQWHLWRIRDKSNTRYYDIEHEEEYLYNYVSDDNYGKTTDGMEWGLPNSQISSQYNAFSYSLDWGDGILGAIGRFIGNIINNQITNKPKYDFYNNTTEAQNGGTPRPYMGRTFSNEIVEKTILTNDKTGRLELIETPASVIEYCYHKNKRDANGNIITQNGSSYNEENVKWFTPSIDQIEEIVISGYSEFDVFQDKYYWSSQPSYKPVNWTATVQVFIDFDVNGLFYFDDTTRARATKVNMVNNIPEKVSSGTSNAEESWDLNKTPPTITQTGQTMVFDSGNRPRTKALAKQGEDPQTAINRVRCVYRSGLVSEL